MIADTVAHLRAEGQRVFLDAEHFFDGYRADPDYALEVVRTATEAGADLVVLCDTNGGMLPDRAGDEVVAVGPRPPAPGSASTATTTPRARSPTRWRRCDAGVTHVQGTANGYGERCGNANLFTRGRRAGAQVGPPGAAGRAALPEMSRVSHAIAEVANLTPATHQPYVGYLRLRPQGRPARLGDQGRPRCSTSTSIPRWSATTCGCWSPTWPAGPRSSSRARSSGSTCPATSDGRPGRRAGQGPGGPRLHVRGRRRLVRAAAARRAAGEPARALHARVLAGHRRAAAGRRGGQRGHGQAAGQGRADRRHRRGQRPGQRARHRAAHGAGADLPASWPSWSWSTTRCASSRARTAPGR